MGHARDIFQPRITLCGEIFRTSAVSSNINYNLCKIIVRRVKRGILPAALLDLATLGGSSAAPDAVVPRCQLFLTIR